VGSQRKGPTQDEQVVIRAVLDANVYVSAAVRPEGPPGRIIDRFLRGRFEIVMSQAIVDEVLRALGYPKVRKYVQPGLDPELWFEDIVVLSHFVAGEREFAGASKDPDDDKYIAAAIEGRAGFVVAGDADLLDLKEYEGVRIVSPRAFLELLVA
jgi:putative PIN family toxin of toxin-antitoxin system